MTTRKTKDYYNSINKGYNELYGEEQLRKLEFIKTRVRGNVLDVGCGTGLVTSKMKNVVGLDVSVGMIKQYNGKKVIGDAHSIPFKDRSFDLCISLTVLQDVQNPEKVLLEMKRVGKKLIFSMLHETWTKEKIKELTEEAGITGIIIGEEKDFIFVQE